MEVVGVEDAVELLEVLRESSTSMWAGADSTRMRSESRPSLYARGRMNKPMPMAITESTQYHEVSAMMPAPMRTPTDPTASATTSR